MCVGHHFLCFVHWCSTYRLRLWSDALFWRVGGGPQRTPCSPWGRTFTFFSEKHFRQQWPPCFPPGGRLLLLVGHDPHSLSDWSLGCHFRSPHSPLRATRRTRPEKWKFSATLKVEVKVPIFQWGNPPHSRWSGRAQSSGCPGVWFGTWLERWQILSQENYPFWFKMNTGEKFGSKWRNFPNTWMQGGITCGAIEDPRKSSKAIDERVIINFRDKNGVIACFRDKNVYR